MAVIYANLQISTKARKMLGPKLVRKILPKPVTCFLDKIYTPSCSFILIITLEKKSIV